MSKTALLLIDLQNDYFPGGLYELVGIEKAAENAQKLLKAFRDKEEFIVHVRHEILEENPPFFEPDSQGAQIHKTVAPAHNEDVVLKHEANSYLDTNLMDILEAHDIEKLVICGAMSHMCIDATVRASADFGFECIVAHDACATRDMEFGGKTIPAAQVHAAFMGALEEDYAEMKSVEEMIGG